jgi:PAS domain S-box-containing protein
VLSLGDVLVMSAVATISSLVLLGWIAGWAPLTRFFLGFHPMAPSSAVCFLFIALGFAAHRRSWPGVARCVWAAILAYESMNLIPPVTDALARLSVALTQPPNTALAFVCLSLGLLLSFGPRRSWIAPRLALLGGQMLIGLLTLLGHLSGLRPDFNWDARGGMSPLTACVFLLLGAWQLQVMIRSAGRARLPAIFFMVALVLLIVCTRISVVLNNESAAANRLVARTFAVKENLKDALAGVIRSQSIDRGIALLSEPGFPEQRTAQFAKTRENLDTLARRVADNPIQLARVAELRDHIALTETESDRLLRAVTVGDPTAVRDLLALQLPDLVKIMADEEERILGQRLENIRRIQRNERLVLIVGLVLAAVALATAFFLVHRARRALEHANDELEDRVLARTAELRHSEAGLHFIADTMSQLVWVLECRNQRESFNRGWLDYTGASHDDLIQGGWKSRVHPDDLPDCLQEWQAAQTAERAGEGEFRLQRARDGLHRWHRWYARPQRDATGAIVRWATIAFDIHDQKTAAEMLERSVHERTRELGEAKAQLETAERLQGAVLDGTVFSVIATDVDGLITVFNAGAERMLGYRREEVIKRCTPEILHDRAEVAGRAEQLSRELGRTIEPGFKVFVRRAELGEVEEREWTYIRKDGSRLPVLLSVTALRSHDGAIQGFLGLAYDLTMRKAAEQAMRVSRERLASIFSAMAEGIVQQNADGVIIEANPAAERILGLTRAQLEGRTSRDPRWRAVREDGSDFPGDQHPAVVTLRTGVAQRDVIMGVHKPNGELAWISINSEPIHDELGRTRSVVSSFIDISQRKAQETALRDSERRLRLAADAAGIAVWEWDLASDAIHWDNDMFSMYGRPRTPGGMVTIDDWRAAILPEDLPEQEQKLQATLQSLGRGRREFRIRRDDDGEIRHLSSVEVVIVNRQGKAERMTGINRDVTDFKNAERALRGSEERFRQAFEFAGIGVALIGLDGRWLRVNPAICAIVGYTPEALLAKTFQEITHPDDLATDLGHVRELLAGARAYYQMEKRYLHAEGRVVWVRLTASLVRDNAGQPVYFVSQMEDITQARELEENLALMRDQALESSRLKSEFLASMSHEIRTPMNGVIGMARLLMDTALNAEQRRMNQVVLNSAENLLTVINDILDFSKIEAGKLRIDEADFSLRDTVEETVALLAPQARLKGLALTCAIDESLAPTLRGDAGRIQQVVTNLLGNALKFTERGSIKLALLVLHRERRRLRFRLEVADTGIGVAESVRPRLFQPFTQADGSDARKFGGTGLGLAISRQLIELMGGRIGFDSREGEGSRFWFEVELPVSAPPPAKTPDTRLGAVRVLLLDQDESNRRLISAHLAELGMEVEITATAAEAHARLSAQAADGQPIRLALLDANLPAGLTLARSVGQDDKFSATALLLMASARPAEIEDVMREARVDFVLDKPVRDGALRRAVLSALSRQAGASSAPPAARATDQPPMLRLLVAEDNRANQLVARMLLGKMGYTVEVAETGREALDRLAHGRFDAILMDCQMPEMDGYETTRRIRQGDAGRDNAHLPIVALTAYAMKGDRERCLAAGMDDYVTKPLNIDELRAALSRRGLRPRVEKTAAPPAPVVEQVESVAEPTASSIPVLDPTQLQQLSQIPSPRGGSLDHELARMLCKEMPARLAALTTLIGAREQTELMRAAHTLAGSCANLGAKSLRAAANALEAAAREQRWAEAPTLTAGVEAEWRRLHQALRDLYPALP